MLTEFISDVLRDIDKATQAEMTNLIAAESGSRHDLIRGRIHGLANAKHSVEQLVKRYNLNEAETAPQRTPDRVQRHRRHIGGH